MPHICGDEIMAFILAMPFVATGYYWLKNKFKAWRKR